MDSCEQSQSRIMEGDKASAADHLAGCARCRQWLATFEQVVGLAALPPASPEEEAALALAPARARAAFRTVAQPRFPVLRVGAIAAAAACSLVVLLNLGAWTDRPARPAGDLVEESMEIAAWALTDPLDEAGATEDLEDELGLDLEETEQSP